MKASEQQIEKTDTVKNPEQQIEKTETVKDSEQQIATTSIKVDSESAAPAAVKIKLPALIEKTAYSRCYEVLNPLTEAQQHDVLAVFSTMQQQNKIHTNATGLFISLAKSAEKEDLSPIPDTAAELSILNLHLNPIRNIPIFNGAIPKPRKILPHPR